MRKFKKAEKVCEECGDAIPSKRLKLLPRAEYCVDCQDKLERAGLFRRHKMDVVAKQNGGGEVEELNEVFHRGSEV